MKNNELFFYRSSGIEKHNDGSFTLFGYVENKNEEEVARYKMRYIDYNVEQAIRKFQIDLKEFAELLEENNILTNEAYLNYKHTLQKG